MDNFDNFYELIKVTKLTHLKDNNKRFMIEGLLTFRLLKYQICLKCFYRILKSEKDLVNEDYHHLFPKECNHCKKKLSYELVSSCDNISPCDDTSPCDKAKSDEKAPSWNDVSP